MKRIFTRLLVLPLAAALLFALVSGALLYAVGLGLPAQTSAETLK